MMINLKYFLLVIPGKNIEINFVHGSPPLTGPAIWSVVYTLVYTLSSNNFFTCASDVQKLPCCLREASIGSPRAGGANFIEWSVVSYCWRGCTSVAAILTIRALTSSGSRSSNPVALMMNGSKSLKPSAKAYMEARKTCQCPQPNTCHTTRKIRIITTASRIILKPLCRNTTTVSHGSTASGGLISKRLSIVTWIAAI